MQFENELIQTVVDLDLSQKRSLLTYAQQLKNFQSQRDIRRREALKEIREALRNQG